MPDYQKMYFQLAAKVADAVEILLEAQQNGEDCYIESENAVTFDTNHLSVYAIGCDAAIPNTGDDGGITILIMLMGVSLALAGFALYRGRPRERGAGS